MTPLTPHEQQEIARANDSNLPPVLFVHGLWLLSTSWDNWRQFFEANGYTTLAPGWPDDPETVKAANEDPEVMAHKRLKQVTEHYLDAIGQLARKPAVIGQSFGGLIAEKLAGEGACAPTVAISPVAFRSVLPLPLSALKAVSPVLANPLNAGHAVPLTFEQFHYAFANAVDEAEARMLYEKYAVPAPGAPLFQAAAANLNPWTEDKVDTENGARGPLLLISGEKDHTVPPAVVAAAFKRQQKNPGITKYQEIPNRGHSLTIDNGWRAVAEAALKFIQQHQA
ncbi:MAG TPA: alpha/beta hydrolase [Ktedonobacterales bacterium]